MTGRIVRDDIETLRERADIVEVISGHTQLRKAGRIFKGLCPFHQEKTPSFTVDPGKSVWHCFGCGAGGDVFGFVRQIDGLSFAEAAERLAGRYGVQLRHEGTQKTGDSRKPLLDAVAEAAAFFKDQLMKSPEATGARRYIEARGFSSDDAKEWGLGYSPSSQETLFRMLLAKRFTAKQIVDSGLARVNESGEHRDHFRGRLMFPINDITGSTVGFGARALGSEAPKYVNSPETPVYHKAKILFGLDRARRTISVSGQAVVTEGYTDVVALHKAGITTAVATCGTALGEDHFVTLKRFCDRVVLAFDADAAGAVASERAFGLHASAGIEVLVAPIPAGKDPADVALTEGPEAMGFIIDQAIPLMRFVLEAEVSRHRFDSPGGKSKALRAAVQILSWEPDRVVRGEHAFWLARRVGVSESEVQREIAEVTEGPGPAGQAVAPLRRPGHVKVEREALALLLDQPGRLADEEWMNEDHFTLPEHRIILRALRDGSGRDAASLLDQLPDEGTRRLAAELALTPVTTADPDEVFSRLEQLRLRRQIDSKRATLDRLDSGAEPEKYDALFEELMDLESERRRYEEEG